MHAGSSKRRVEVRGDEVHLYTTVRPIQGRANRDGARIIAENLGVPAGAVSLFRGATSKNKIYHVDGIALARRKTAKKTNGMLVSFLRKK